MWRQQRLRVLVALTLSFQNHHHLSLYLSLGPSTQLCREARFLDFLGSQNLVLKIDTRLVHSQSHITVEAASKHPTRVSGLVAHMALLRYHKVLVGADVWTWSSVASCGTSRTLMHAYYAQGRREPQARSGCYQEHWYSLQCPYV